MKKAAPKRSQKPKPTALKAKDLDRFALALGHAAMDQWSAFPQKMQKTLFEAAVVAGHHDERDELLREQLALFLHGRHPRTEKKRG